jgi:hypothetical protein
MQTKTRRFLAGLSSDELQFLAEFQGCRVLDSCVLDSCGLDGWGLNERLDRFQRLRVKRSEPGFDDQAQKMILLREYLRRAGAQEQSRVSQPA